MNWSQFFELMGGAIGLTATIFAFGGWVVRRWLRAIERSWRARLDALKIQMEAEIKRVTAEKEAEVAILKSQHAGEILGHKSEALRMQQVCEDLQAERTRASQERDALQERLAALESFNGRLWERDLGASTPPFLERSDRKTRFIAVMNLKGGVGKTTIAANVGVGLASKGHRVLLADLDFQGSLTSLCIDPDAIQKANKERRTAERLFDLENGSPYRVRDLAQQVRSVILESGMSDVVPATDRLAEAELRAQGRWLAANHPDARFLFRMSFYRPEVLDHYDYVFFDCPPRLTTASVNALACSDYLLVPVTLDQASVEALPRTLVLLNRFPQVTRAHLLGVVANRVELFRGKELVQRQKRFYNALPQTIARAGCNGATLFQATVKNSHTCIEDAGNLRRIAAAEDEGFRLFADVISEVEARTQA